VSEPKTVKNRMHLDLRMGADDVDAVVARLTDRGATFLRTGREGPHSWVTMPDPEGNEFCVSG
jgi:predicted enzyme related to lactoylglutathione lyase